MTFRNNISAFGWILAFFFLIGTAAFIRQMVREGPPVELTPLTWLMVAALWAGGIGASVHLAGQPCIRGEVKPDGHFVAKFYYPFKVKTYRVAAGKMQAAQVFEVKDSEGEPYFKAKVTLTDGTEIVLAEGHQQDLCAQTCARFNAAIGQAA